MPLQIKHAIIMEPDPQTLKGLVLLLEDMQIKVSSARNQDELQSTVMASTTCPDLLILPLVLANGMPGRELIKELRLNFKHAVSAILLSTDNALIESAPFESNIFVLPYLIKPNDLRSKIQDVLKKNK